MNRSRKIKMFSFPLKNFSPQQLNVVFVCCRPKARYQVWASRQMVFGYLFFAKLRRKPREMGEKSFFFFVRAAHENIINLFCGDQKASPFSFSPAFAFWMYFIREKFSPWRRKDKKKFFTLPPTKKEKVSVICMELPPKALSTKKSSS